MKVSKFSRNKNRTNDRKDSTKQAKHLILNAVPQIRTKKKVMINIYIYIYILHVYMYITYILHIYKNTNTYIYMIWILLSYWPYFQSLMSFIQPIPRPVHTQYMSLMSTCLHLHVWFYYCWRTFYVFHLPAKRIDLVLSPLK